MGQSAGLISGFGWVVDRFEGDYAGDLGSILEADDAELDVEVLNTKLKEHGLDAVFERFGYDLGATALLWRPSVHESYDWYHDGSEHGPKTTQQAQWRRELLQVLDEIGWDEANLGEPTWLLLVSYG